MGVPPAPSPRNKGLCPSDGEDEEEDARVSPTPFLRSRQTMKQTSLQLAEYRRQRVEEWIEAYHTWL